MIEDGKDVAKRDLVSWRINKLNDFDSLNKWVNAQGNIQISLTTLVRHMIDRFGYRDITDIEIQKAMFLEPYSNDLQYVIDEIKKNLSQNSAAVESNSNIISNKEVEEKVEPVKTPETDYFYRSVDTSLL